ncbi:MAG: hypothetical protein GC168_09745 [Candidatus Hydrogenedens sp.]|nr:hypothetical protein [Candidatus Hydrogenedens sp.]
MKYTAIRTPHLRVVSRRPAVAQGVPTDVKLVFLRDVIDAAIPLFENKDPQNPLPPTSTGTDTTT